MNDGEAVEEKLLLVSASGSCPGPGPGPGHVLNASSLDYLQKILVEAAKPLQMTPNLCWKQEFTAYKEHKCKHKVFLKCNVTNTVDNSSSNSSRHFA
ncbi:hypothetical protein ACLKA7_006208 [Drosophila subpalustris]